MKLMMPKSARKSPKMLMNCAIQTARKPGRLKMLPDLITCGSDVIRPFSYHARDDTVDDCGLRHAAALARAR
jgi:hypothetical protein